MEVPGEAAYQEAELSFATMQDPLWDLAPALVWVATRDATLVCDTPTAQSPHAIIALGLERRFMRWKQAGKTEFAHVQEAWERLAPLIALGAVKAFAATAGLIFYSSKTVFRDEALNASIAITHVADFPGAGPLALVDRLGTEYLDVQLSREDIMREFPAPESPAPIATATVVANDPRRFERGKGGRPPSYDWPGAKILCFGIFEDDGLPGPNPHSMPLQATLEKRVASWMLERHGKEPSPSNIRQHVSKWMKEFSRVAASSA